MTVIKYIIDNILKFQGGLWDLIVLVPDHCLLFTFYENWTKTEEGIAVVRSVCQQKNLKLWSPSTKLRSKAQHEPPNLLYDS